jgi:hypothetical protein
MHEIRGDIVYNWPQMRNLSTKHADLACFQ